MSEADDFDFVERFDGNRAAETVTKVELWRLIALQATFNLELLITLGSLQRGEALSSDDLVKLHQKSSALSKAADDLILRPRDA